MWAVSHDTPLSVAHTKDSIAAGLFEALDGRRLSYASRHWSIEISGVFIQTDCWWLQLSLTGTTPYCLAVKIDVGQTAEDVAAALSSWLALPSQPSARVRCLG